MKTRLFYLFLVAAVLGCSKSDDATPSGTAGCTVSLKGTTYTFSVAICADAIGGTTIDGLSATGSTAAMSFVISRDTSDPTTNSLALTMNGGVDVYVAADGITSQPTINRSAKTWTFSGTASNGTDSGAISGNCTCTN